MQFCVSHWKLLKHKTFYFLNLVSLKILPNLIIISIFRSFMRYVYFDGNTFIVSVACRYGYFRRHQYTWRASLINLQQRFVFFAIVLTSPRSELERKLASRIVRLTSTKDSPPLAYCIGGDGGDGSGLSSARKMYVRPSVRTGK